MREQIAHVVGRVPQVWVEELLLQTYLFAGLPRALNATREWRRLRRAPPPMRLSRDLLRPLFDRRHETGRAEVERTLGGLGITLA